MLFVALFVVVATYLLRLSFGGGWAGDAWDTVSGAGNGAWDKVDQELGNAADALGINYDESKKAAGTIAGAYVGGGYGAGLEALGMGVTGGYAGGAAAGGAAANAAANYVLRPDGTFVKKEGAKYAASDTYGGFDQAKRDWFYNQEQASGRPWTEEQFKLAQAQYDAQEQRKQHLGEIDAWQKSRNPYYTALYDSRVQAAQKQNQQAYADSMKRMQLQHAGRGTLGGSQSTYNGAQIGAAKALKDSRAAQAADAERQGLINADSKTAYELRMQQNGPNAYMDALTQAMKDSQNIKAGSESQYGNLEQLKQQDNQAYQNSMSQIYGQAIGNGAGGAATFAGGV